MQSTALGKRLSDCPRTPWPKQNGILDANSRNRDLITVKASHRVALENKEFPQCSQLPLGKPLPQLYRLTATA